MPKLTLAVRIAAASILLFSLAHIMFWAFLAYICVTALNNGQFTMLFVALCMVSAGGCSGLIVGVGIFYAKNWARLAAIVLAAIISVVCAFALLVLSILIVGSGNWGLLDGLVESNRGNFALMACGYLFVLSVAIWWVFLFSRKSVIAQFSEDTASSPSATLKKQPACPPPIALLAWLMISSSVLSTITWPLVLGKIPAMLFTHVFAASTSKGIWAANLVLFLGSGIGLLKLQRWSYNLAIALHVFWAVSLFFSQLSPGYSAYIRECLLALQFPSTINDPTASLFPNWLTAILSVLPTFLLVAGLFYYRRGFLKAAAESSRR